MGINVVVYQTDLQVNAGKMLNLKLTKYKCKHNFVEHLLWLSTRNNASNTFLSNEKDYELVTMVTTDSKFSHMVTVLVLSLLNQPGSQVQMCPKCDTTTQTMHHLLKCPILEQECTAEDLAAYNNTAQKCIQLWLNCVWCFVDSLRRRQDYCWIIGGE